MFADPNHEDFATEHQIFWMLVKKAHKRDDVGRVYLAIQAAIAFKRETVDVGWAMSTMMAEGRKTTDNSCDHIGAEGLAYFYWLYEINLTSTGDTDCHHYSFRRRYDGAQIIAYLKTDPAPKSLRFQQQYERARRRLEKKRETLLGNYHWHSTAVLFDRYSGHAPTPLPT